jgi:hypothetical protein
MEIVMVFFSPYMKMAGRISQYLGSDGSFYRSSRDINQYSDGTGWAAWVRLRGDSRDISPLHIIHTGSC